jgi:hypothetical protein
MRFKSTGATDLVRGPCNFDLLVIFSNSLLQLIFICDSHLIVSLANNLHGLNAVNIVGSKFLRMHLWGLAFVLLCYDELMTRKGVNSTLYVVMYDKHDFPNNCKLYNIKAREP